MNVALIGVGLIGGSFARAALDAGEAQRVVGYDVDPAALAAAVRIRAVTAVASSVEEAVRDADLVLLAVPVGVMAEVMRALAPALAVDALVTDVGSTKAGVIEAARTELRAAFPRFVPGHPIAGGERPGVESSDPRLFEGKLFIATPVAETDAGATARIERLWQRLGSHVERMDPAEHDRVFAAVSHLPHLLAFALVAHIAREPDADRKLGKAGAGFRDFTRIAASSPRMWRDVCIANRDALADELTGYRAVLDELQDALARRDGAALESVFRAAADCRRRHASRLDAE